jgi:cation:H+ antiporter
MVITVFLLIASLAALYFGAEWLVRGSSSLALRASISPLAVGLTVVAFGTSSPELVVSLNATLGGQGNIAAGNVIGSNIFNIALILGLSAIVHPLQAKMQLFKIDIPVMLVASVLFTVLFWDGTFGRLEGGLFFLGILIYTSMSLYYSGKNKDTADQTDDGNMKILKHWALDIGYILVGLAVLVFASDLLVKEAVIIARSVGISEAVTGLTIVAAGTSMPELATSVVAAMKKQSDIAIGNIVGSNIFNILSIMGLTALVNPVIASQVNHADLLVMTGISVLLLPLVRTGLRISRQEGALFVFLYVIYTLYLLNGMPAFLMG